MIHNRKTIVMISSLAANVFGLCVSLPLHKCSNYSRKFIGQIAQNPCQQLAGFSALNFNRSTSARFHITPIHAQQKHKQQTAYIDTRHEARLRLYNYITYTKNGLKIPSYMKIKIQLSRRLNKTKKFNKNQNEKINSSTSIKRICVE